MSFDIIKISYDFYDSPVTFYLFVQQKTAAPLTRKELKTVYVTETQTITTQLSDGQNSRGLTP
jgi:hypothetical protein